MRFCETNSCLASLAKAAAEDNALNKNRNSSKQVALAILSAVLALPLMSCTDNNDNLIRLLQNLPQADNPVVTGPITGGGGDDCCVVEVASFPVNLTIPGLDYEPGTPFYTFLNYPMAEVGFVETEFFYSGTATSYISSDDLGPEGEWEIQPAEVAEYTSRMVVLRPADSAKFNGTVVVEWFNVSGGIDAAPDLLQMHVEMIREGYAWVGLSAQSAGIEGGGAFSLPLKVVDPTRYGSLSHPGDSFSYDIFSQGAQAVRNPMGVDPLDGLKVERMIAVGQSQSAGRLATYFNAVHPTIDLFDAFIIHGRGSGGASSLSQAPQVSIPAPRPTLIRTDLPQPVIALQNETDVPGSIAARQEDSVFYRMWEITGSAHTDLYTTLIGNSDQGDDPTFADVKQKNDARPPFIECLIPVNDGPGHWVANAALSALDRWIRVGESAPSAPFIEWDEAAGDFVLDEFGNAVGGIRTPWVDAPVATLRGTGQPPADIFCGLLGTTERFDTERLAELYPTKQAYVDAIDAATDSAVDAGFILSADAALIKERARSSPLPVMHPADDE